MHTANNIRSNVYGNADTRKDEDVGQHKASKPCVCPHFILFNLVRENVGNHTEMRAECLNTSSSPTLITMKVYRNTELAHLKWKLINQDGLTSEQADERINELKKWRKKNNGSK